MAIETVRLTVPDSTMIESISYHYGLEKLTVRFNNKTTYVYDDVPSWVVLQLQTASSLGKSFNALVRHQYNYHKVTHNGTSISTNG